MDNLDRERQVEPGKESLSNALLKALRSAPPRSIPPPTSSPSLEESALQVGYSSIYFLVGFEKEQTTSPDFDQQSGNNRFVEDPTTSSLSQYQKNDKAKPKIISAIVSDTLADLLNVENVESVLKSMVSTDLGAIKSMTRDASFFSNTGQTNTSYLEPKTRFLSLVASVIKKSHSGEVTPIPHTPTQHSLGPLFEYTATEDMVQTTFALDHASSRNTYGFQITKAMKLTALTLKEDKQFYALNVIRDMSQDMEMLVKDAQYDIQQFLSFKLTDKRSGEWSTYPVPALNTDVESEIEKYGKNMIRLAVDTLYTGLQSSFSELLPPDIASLEARNTYIYTNGPSLSADTMRNLCVKLLSLYDTLYSADQKNNYDPSSPRANEKISLPA